MTYTRLLAKIKQHTWWEERAPGVFQFIMYPLRAFIEQCKYFHPKYATMGILMSQDDIFWEETPEEEKQKIYDFIFEKSRRDKKYLLKKRRDAEVHKKRFLATGRYFEQNKHKLTNKQFWSVYSDYMLIHYFGYVCYGGAWECVDVFTAYHLEPLLKKELPNLSDDKIRDIMRTLGSPAHLSFMEKERLLFLELCIGLYKYKNCSINNISTKWRLKLKLLSDKYFWIRNTYANTKYLTPADYLQEIKDTINNNTLKHLRTEQTKLQNKPSRLIKEQKKILKQHKLSPDLKLHLYLSRVFGELIDDRKQHMMMSNHYINAFCEELARRFKIDIWEIKYYLPEDFKNLLLKNKRLNPKVAGARRRFSAYVIEKRGMLSVATTYYGRAARRIYQALFKGQSYKVKSLKGQVASAPVKKISGTVQIIMDTHKEKFTPGNILVTTMTRPEFVPYVRQAKAIITDEGGLTCHAAIVSRELKIPCIIGTKIATRVLRSGQRVTIDLQTGMIKKN
jgi:phosphohistidine swiveling domain-containing protein